MPPTLARAHATLDRAVDRCYRSPPSSPASNSSSASTSSSAPRC
ncbi:type IIL restriction-modification enzyme MmeI [Hymenobacter lapidiphilus]|nr:type IIL restriction-modification enzyme MmeI [Hymenobacter sp. CCM 8763]